MKKGGAVLVIIGGSVGLIQAIPSILFGAIGLRLDTDYSGLSFTMGWIALLFSLALVVFGSFVIRASKLKTAEYCLYSSVIAVLLATGVFVTILITAIDPSEGNFSAEEYGILWSSGWYIATFLVFGVVGSILAKIGIRSAEFQPNKSIPED